MNALEEKIKCYKLDELLCWFSVFSKKMYHERMPIKEVKWIKKLGNINIEMQQPLTAWSLADMAYIAIKYSNDFRAKQPTEEDIYKLNNLNAIATEEEAGLELKKISSENILLSIGVGLTQKQFWYQEIVRGKKIFYNFLRYYVLLSEIPPHFPRYKLPSDDLKEITGFDLKTFSQLLACAWALTYNNSPLLSIAVSEELKNKIPIATETNLKKCLDFFIADYSYYRKSGHPNNPLFFRPIIKTSKNKLIISNAFIWARKFYEGAYWLIRDKYQKEKSLTFINNFGEYYEKYVEIMLEYYLPGNRFEKIERADVGKRADWLINTENYILIIEQKSCIMSIALKKEYPSIQDIDKYLENFKEAFLQIDSTAKNIEANSKQTIKLILHFERLHMRERILKDRVINACKDYIKDFSHYFFIDTEEFERFIQLLADNESGFNELIQTKIAYEQNPILAERANFDSMLNKYDAEMNIKFLESRKTYFEDLFGVL